MASKLAEKADYEAPRAEEMRERTAEQEGQILRLQAEVDRLEAPTEKRIMCLQ